MRKVNDPSVLFPQTIELSILHYADNFALFTCLLLSQAQAPSQWVFVREIAPSHTLADHRHLSPMFAILWAEDAPGYQRDAHRLEILRRDHADIDLFIPGARGLSRHEDSRCIHTATDGGGSREAG